MLENLEAAGDEGTGDVAFEEDKLVLTLEGVEASEVFSDDVDFVEVAVVEDD